MAEFPILPLEVGALIADTRHMTAEEFGAYTRILLTMWLHGGKLDANDRGLMLVAGVAPHRWSRVKKVALGPMTIDGNSITQKRLSKTIARLHEVRKRRSRSSLSRWIRKM